MKERRGRTGIKKVSRRKRKVPAVEKSGWGFDRRGIKRIRMH